ncbi:hypothetical protein BCR36DRAFT_344788 [Piromyces finnis]|uniref:Afadin and alpha-actinin-binding-domain-containing protein n=1 Tax=Piromyces finnis TaxID=1754191 RepID=A0A1Y1VJM7_9FUNG|nr:hypothetical protein BCR36DRAFT_344788 [Piromyces finnis]|eukprot:ORX57912.1 hypothetical protein BCR36DRAFT_344788 [Piromyces finnis]
MMSSDVPSPLKMQGLEELLTKDKENNIKTDLNIKDSLKYLNHQLSIQGFPSYINLKGLKKEDARHIIECIFALIQQHQKDNDYKQEMMNDLRQLALDNDTLNSNMDKLKQKHEHSQHELKTLNNKIIELTGNNKEIKRNNTTLKEKIKHLENTLQSLKNQYMHEIRKKEIELQKVKEKLQKRFNEKMSNSGIRFHLANPLSKIVISNDKKSSNEDMFSILISNYEHSEKELHNENCLLRQTLYDIYKEIELILGVEEDEREFDPNNVEEVTNILVQNEYIRPEDAQFKLPLSISREYLGQKVNDLLEQFKEYIFSIQEDVNDQEQEEETSIDNKELAYKSSEDSNMQIDEEYSNKKLNNKDRKLVYAELEEEYLKIEKQKEQLESEKKKFTEAAVRMGKERALLAQEKESLENEKKKFEEEKINTRINSINSESSNTPINNPELKSFSYSLNSNLSTPIPTKFSPNINNLNKNSYIDSSFNTTNSLRISESPLSQSILSNTPIMLNSESKSSRSIKNINNQDEFMIRNKEKDDINAFINQALERINKNKQSFLSLSKTYSLKNNSELNKS